MTKLCYIVFSLWALNTNAQISNEMEYPIELSYTIYISNLNDKFSPELLNSKELNFKTHTKAVKTHPKETYWIKVDFSDYLEKLKTDGHWFIITGWFNDASYFHNNKGTLREYKYGSFDVVWNVEKGIYADRVKVGTEDLIDSKYIYFKLNKFINTTVLEPGLIVAYQPILNTLNIEEKRKNTSENVIPTYLFLGMAVPILLFMLVLYLYTKKKDFLFYALYLLCFVGFFGLPYFEPYTQYFGKNSFNMYFLMLWLDLGTNFFYILFVRVFLDTRKRHQVFHKILNIGLWYVLVIVITSSILLLLGKYAAYNSSIGLRAVVMSLFIVTTTIHLFMRTKDKLVYFIIFGSVVLSIGSLLLYFTGAMAYHISCVIAEMMIFGLGLVYKVKELHHQNEVIKEQAITNEIRKLKAQIKPHFIFNSLNSIQNLVYANDKVSTLKYLSKLSFMLRNVLEGTKQASIPLVEEIEFLHSYLALESLRFDCNFNYKIDFAETLDADAIEIPPLLVQPFVENAVLHGLLNKKEGDRSLLIEFQKENEYLVCTVDDNGIGREESRKINVSLNRQKKSNGVEIIKKHLELLDTKKKKACLQIVDKYDLHGKSIGTTVSICLPLY